MQAGPAVGTSLDRPSQPFPVRRAGPSGNAASIAVAIVLSGCLVAGWQARHSTFTADEWSFILQRRGFSADVFLKPHGEHLSALPILAYKVLLATFGLSSYVPFIVLLLALHAVVCLLLYALARRYVGPWVALAPVAVVAVLGPAWNDLLWAFQIGYLASVAAGLGMVLCLERGDRSGDVGAGALLGVSLLCSSIGLGMVVLAAVLIALQRPRAWRRLWAVAVPVGLYLLWYAFYGVNTIRTSNVLDASAVSAASGLGGCSLPDRSRGERTPRLHHVRIRRRGRRCRVPVRLSPPRRPPAAVDLGGADRCSRPVDSPMPRLLSGPGGGFESLSVHPRGACASRRGLSSQGMASDGTRGRGSRRRDPLGLRGEHLDPPPSDCLLERKRRL